jgi:hypothetical protein
MRQHFWPQRHRGTERTPGRAACEHGSIRRAPRRGALRPRRSAEMNRWERCLRLISADRLGPSDGRLRRPSRRIDQLGVSVSLWQILVALGLVLTAASSFAQQPAARIVSPEVATDRRVTFRLAAPQAREILLSGEFMPGSKPFEKDANGLWTLTIGPLEPEIYHYNVTIDGVRTIDPNNPDVRSF